MGQGWEGRVGYGVGGGWWACDRAMPMFATHIFMDRNGYISPRIPAVTPCKSLSQRRGLPLLTKQEKRCPPHTCPDAQSGPHFLPMAPRACIATHRLHPCRTRQTPACKDTARKGGQEGKRSQGPKGLGLGDGLAQNVNTQRGLDTQQGANSARPARQREGVVHADRDVAAPHVWV